MRYHRVKSRLLARCAYLVVMLVLLLIVPHGVLGQHFAGGHSGGFSGGHVGGFSGGGFRGGFFAPHSFSGFPGPASRAFGFAPRMSWTAPHYSSVPQRSTYTGYHPTYGAETHRGWDHRERYRRPYPGFGYGGYPYMYANSWGLLPWDVGYPDLTGYADSGAVEPNNMQVQAPYYEEQPQEDQGYRPDYSPTPYQSTASQTVVPKPPQDEPKLTLVFKDGHTQAIQNYVLTPREVIIADASGSGRVRCVALSALNLPATELAAQRDGLDFSPPSL